MKRKYNAILDEAVKFYEKELLSFVGRFNNANTQEAVDRIYDDFTRLLLQPWEMVRTRDHPRRWGYAWNYSLQKMSQHKTALWKNWKRSGNPDARARHKDIDRRINRTVRENRRRSFNEFRDRLAPVTAAQALTAISRTLKARRRNSKRNAESTARIAPEMFAHLVATQHPRRDVDSPKLSKNLQHTTLGMRWLIMSCDAHLPAMQPVATSSYRRPSKWTQL